MERPTFYLLSTSYMFEAARGPHILGALCSSMKDPISYWKPDNASEVLAAGFGPDDKTHKPIEIVMESAAHTLSRTVSWGISVGLPEILEFAWKKNRSDKYDVNAQWIRTVRLPQQPDIYKCILKDESVREFRREHINKRYFMITGFKSCFNGVFDRSCSKDRTFEVDLQVPLDLILDAAGVPVPPGYLPSIGGSRSWSTSWQDFARYSIAGETIIAIEYREVLRRSWLARLLQQRENELERRLAESAKEVALGRGMFGKAGHGSDSDDDEDLNSDIPDINEYLELSEVLEEEGSDAVLLGMKVDDTAASGEFLGY